MNSMQSVSGAARVMCAIWQSSTMLMAPLSINYCKPFPLLDSASMELSRRHAGCMRASSGLRQTVQYTFAKRRGKVSPA